MRRALKVDLQQQFIKAITPLRKTHPKINENLPVGYLKTHEILRDRHGVNYFKGFWIVWMLILRDPSIMQDKKSTNLRSFARFCATRIQIVENV